MLSHLERLTSAYVRENSLWRFNFKKKNSLVIGAKGSAYIIITFQPISANDPPYSPCNQACNQFFFRSYVIVDLAPVL